VSASGIHFGEVRYVAYEFEDEKEDV